MPTAESVKAKIQNLISLANDITGNNDSDLTSAVTTLSEGYGQGGGGTPASEIIDGSATEITNGDTKTIREYSFYINSKITSVDFPAVTRIKNYAFYKCSSLRNISFPEVTTIDNYAFQQCVVLEEAIFPKAMSFSGSQGDHQFSGCAKLKTASFPEYRSIGTNNFDNCTSLTTINFPKVTCINDNAFYGCTGLINVNFPSLTDLRNACFYGCSNLTTAILGSIPQIKNTVFKNCSSLNTLVIKTNSICTMLNTAAFDGTPFASGGTGGTVYVPQALIESYKTASNWATLYDAGTCTFAPIEGSEYE